MDIIVLNDVEVRNNLVLKTITGNQNKHKSTLRCQFFFFFLKSSHLSGRLDRMKWIPKMFLMSCISGDSRC